MQAQELLVLPGQTDIRSWMVQLRSHVDERLLVNLEADEEAAKQMGLDFSLEETEPLEEKSWELQFICFEDIQVFQ